MTDHREWVKAATGDSLRAVARAIGVNESNFNGQAARGLSADRVIAIAHAYSLNAVDALLETGHLNMSDAPQKSDVTLNGMIELLQQLQDNAHVQGAVQNDYGLVADESPDEGGTPDDYEP